MLRQHVDAVRQLQRDIRALISDIEFIERGGVLRYLLDSSEISAYVLPDEAQPIALVGDETPLAHAISYELTTLILFGHRDASSELLGATLYLAPPYIAEIEGLAHNVSERARKNKELLEKGRQEIDREAEEFARSPEYQQFERLLALERVDAADIERVTRFLNDRASRLMHVVRLDNPAERLEDVLTSDRVANLRSRYPDVDMHAATADRWWNGLSVRDRDDGRLRDFAEGQTRRDTARRHDSVAMGFLYGANSRNPNWERFRLITRSQAMQDVMQPRDGATPDLPHWSTVGGSPLRHPRSILAWIVATAIAGKSGALGRLRRLATSLEVFRLSAERPDETRGADIDAQFEKIRLDWRTSGELAFSITEADVTKRHANASIEQLRRAVTLSANPDALSKHISEWVRRFAAGVSRSLMLLGFMMGGSQEIKRKAIEALTLREGRDGAMMLSSSLNWMPYSIEFHGQTIREYWQIHGGIKAEEFSRFLEEWLLAEVEAKQQDEALLAVAYLTASIRNWQAAEKYVDPVSSALREGEREHNHEFLFLRAVCKRKHNPTPERLREGLKLIEQAIEDKSKRVAGGYRDPRFIKEQSVLLFKVDESARDDEAAQKAVVLANEALEHEDSDDYLKVQIYNNLCYYILNREGPLDTPHLEEVLDKLVEHQRTLEPDKRKWSPNIRDTVAWATWNLGTYDGKQMTISEMQDLAQEYKEIIEAAADDGDDRAQFAQRLSTIENALRERSDANSCE